MKNIVLLTFLLFGFSSFKGNEELKSSLGSTIADFKLKNIDGNIISLSDYKNAKGFIIVFTCNHCPFAKLYTKRYNNLNTKFSKLNVPLLAINSMDTTVYDEESFALMQKKAKSDHFNFPYLCDATQSVGKQFGANHTPHAYIIWKVENNWEVKYSGSIDDNGEHPDKAKPLIANAVNNLLNNMAIENPETPSFGCRIYYRKN